MQAKNQRNQRISTFQQSLEKIKSYAIRGDGNDWKRCMNCGIFWLDNAILLNTRQLSILILKCKSSINGSFQKMGYNSSLGNTNFVNTLIEKYPAIKNYPIELKKWSVRELDPKKVYKTKERAIKTVSTKIPETFEFPEMGNVPQVQNELVANTSSDNSDYLFNFAETENTIWDIDNSYLYGDFDLN
ncbi:potassium/sodium hyperpolarization-activated cyclic nucleotide-gated channel 1 [Histomonas meleagridis]|uniref:potassium/sodium hyperpolarization-activated cyclic nucleotide-gated channel 1 n=1 Tax=Histomonas meleagridis TaxID=135588 RepID=UPI00355A731D|nr:potassium/sodium hyperpolarization-activated cyclic nucleotide-gated channel 1 [Histomonas meleagridis]KAH0801014.1 potassium/sodium hyperpolarization-activated cyclic nucleotide-gated channel 1 [Histomonas meleagridis]